MTEVAAVGERPGLVGVVQQASRPRTVLAWGEPVTEPAALAAQLEIR